MSDIFIFEGPSGSGKTTFLKTLCNMGKLKLVQPLFEIPRPRAYDFDDNGVRLSSFKDLVYLTTAIGMNEPYLGVDRGFISQIIYGAIRRGDSELKNLSLVKSHLENLIRFVRTDFFIRGETIKWDPQITLVFYLPDLEVILERRAHATNRVYVYSAEKELDLYSRAPVWIPNSILIRNVQEEKNFRESLNDLL